MTESVKIPSNNKPAAIEKGEDGYYSIPVRLAVGDDESGFITLVLKLNYIPDDFDFDNASAISVTMNGMKDESIGFPNRGFVSKYTVISVDTTEAIMLINLIANEVEAMDALHLDHAPFAQIKTSRDQNVFVSSRPGEQYYIAIDIDPKAGDSVPEKEEVSAETIDYQEEK